MRKIQKEQPLTANQERVLSFLNKKGSAYLLVWVASQCMETVLGKAIPNKADLQFKENISPIAGEGIWRPISDILLSLSNQLEDAFSRDRISNESVSKTVPNFVGVVDSLKELQKETFGAFAKHVQLRQ